MKIEEFYDSISGDYKDVVGRLLKEERVKKYLNMFAGATTFEDGKKAIEEKNWEEGFRNIHSLKGNALNLGLTELARVSSELCETMRDGAPTIDISELVELTEKEVIKAKEGIAALE